MSQASYRIAGFSDVPFNPPAERVDENGFFEAGAMTDYLEDYVDQHMYDGRSIRDRILFRTSVDKLEKVDSTWHIHCTKDDSTSLVLKAPQVIVASGATSKPNIPSIRGSEQFQGELIHTVDWAKASFLHDGAIKKVVVLGGGKSAADMVYQCVKEGKQVSWIIRKSGKGPGAFVPGKPIGWFRNPSELGTSRVGSYIFLSGLGSKGWWYWFLFNTWLGKLLYKKAGESGGKQAAQEADFGRADARPSFKELDPRVE